eukprot:6466283-Amphidinium_carterae.1
MVIRGAKRGLTATRRMHDRGTVGVVAVTTVAVTRVNHLGKGVASGDGPSHNKHQAGKRSKRDDKPDDASDGDGHEVGRWRQELVWLIGHRTTQTLLQLQVERPSDLLPLAVL